MKKLFLLLATALCIVSCNSKNNEPENPNTDGLILDEKWILTDNETYNSFEFTESGDYIVEYAHTGGAVGAPEQLIPAKNTTKASIIVPAIYGKYTSDGDNAIIMEDFGRIEVISSENGEVEFSLTLEGEEIPEVLASTIVEPMAASTKTDLLCRKWVFESLGGDYDQEPDEDIPSTVIFSKAQTYLVGYRDGSAKLAQWKWKDESKSTFYFTWDKDHWDEDAWVTITTLTESKLVIEEVDPDDGTKYISILVPAE